MNDTIDATKRCGSCKHRGDEAIEALNGEFDFVTSTYYQCKRVKHGNGSNGHDYQAGEGALAVDGSGYHARFVVENSFGCVLWEQK